MIHNSNSKRATISLTSTPPLNLDRLTLEKIRGIDIRRTGSDEEGIFGKPKTSAWLWTTLALTPLYFTSDNLPTQILQLGRQFVKRRNAEPSTSPVSSRTPLKSKVFIRVTPFGIQTPGVLIDHDLTRLGYRTPGVREPICLIQMRRTCQWIPAELVYLQAPGILTDPLTHDFFRQDQTLNGNN